MNEATTFDVEYAVESAISTRKDFERISEKRLQNQDRPVTRREEFGARQVDLGLEQDNKSMISEGYFLMGELEEAAKADPYYQMYVDAIDREKCDCEKEQHGKNAHGQRVTYSTWHQIDSVGIYDIFTCVICRRLSVKATR